MFTMPAGRYFVGDPCYMFDKSWMKLLERNNFFETKKVEFCGQYLWGDHTAHGDGGFHDQDSVEYSVDAGLIGVVPMSLCEVKEETLKDCGNIVEFDEPFTVKCKDGFFNIGGIMINTDYDDYEDCDGCGNYKWDCCYDEDEEEVE